MSKFFKNIELTGGLFLFLGTVLALVFANHSDLQILYANLKNLHFTLGFTDVQFALTKPLLLWINDGLMVIFFLLIGLELKREILAGHLTDKQQVLLPLIAALGGVIFPAIIYLAFNMNHPLTQQGWAIPVATDIAFVLGVLALLSKHIPKSLRIFLLALAIFDDLAAIIIIALFYTHHLSFLSLLISFACIGVLMLLNRLNVKRISVYIAIGFIMWVSVLKSGVHATLAGVVLGLIIPYKIKDSTFSPSVWLEHGLQPWSAFFILPLFAFVNAGVNLTDTTFRDFLDPVTLGIVLGLVVGKQVGVFSFTFLTVRCGFAKLPENVSWMQLYGAAVLCGIGFTMSLFIASLSFDSSVMLNWDNDRIGILLGSVISGIAGYLLLRASSGRSR